jgi:hypothetical protein
MVAEAAAGVRKPPGRAWLRRRSPGPLRDPARAGVAAVSGGDVADVGRIATTIRYISRFGVRGSARTWVKAAARLDRTWLAPGGLLAFGVASDAEYHETVVVFRVTTALWAMGLGRSGWAGLGRVGPDLSGTSRLFACPPFG